MFGDANAFSSFSVDDVPKAKEFYGQTLGLKVSDADGGALDLHLPTGGRVLVYPKDNHTPATFTVLNIPVGDIEQAVDELARRGVGLDYLNDAQLGTDERGIFWGIKAGQGPNIAWFRDPAGNVVSVIQEP